MARRMGWERLKASTRERYEKKGMTKADYDAGASLKAARGHAKTPERPTQKITREQYPEYFNKRQRLIQELQVKKQRIFGGSPKWDAEKSAKSIRAKPQSNAQLQRAIEMTDEEIYDAVRGAETDFAYLFYYH